MIKYSYKAQKLLLEKDLEFGNLLITIIWLICLFNLQKFKKLRIKWM